MNAAEKVAHTPGPWNYDIFGLAVYATEDPYGHGPMRVADVRGWGHLTGRGACRFDEGKAVAIQKANATLIAAAPAMLIALKQIQKHCPADPDTTRRFNVAWALLEAAIAKAEETPAEESQ